MGYNNKSITVYKDRYAIIRGQIYYYQDKDSIFIDKDMAIIGSYLENCRIRRFILIFANKNTKDIFMKLIVKPSKILAVLNLKHYNKHISYIAKAILTNNYQLGKIE